MLLGWLSARAILELSETPQTVLNEALLYIRIYFLSIPFMVIYNFGAAVLRNYGDTRRPMYYLLLSGIVNVILNLLLYRLLQWNRKNQVCHDSGHYLVKRDFRQ